MPMVPQESVGSPKIVAAVLRLPDEAVKTTGDEVVQSGPGRPSPKCTPRACEGRPPSLNEPSPSSDEKEPPLPALEGLKLSQLGSYDPGRSPLVSVSVHTRSTGLGGLRVGAISPAEISRSCSAEKKKKKKKKSDFSFWEPLSAAGNEQKLEAANLPSCSSCSSSPSPSALSPPANGMVRLPRGKSLRFFIDGEEGLNSEMKSRRQESTAVGQI